MIIVVGKWKQKVARLVAAIILIGIFVAAIPFVAGMFNEKVPVFNSWFQDERPSGNPMRVEEDSNGDSFSKKMDRFVMKVQNFYYQEKE
jgi:hypothetical protein